MHGCACAGRLPAGLAVALSCRPSIFFVMSTEHFLCHVDRAFSLSCRPSEASGDISRVELRDLSTPSLALGRSR
jgi:hypothetical protein